MQVKTVNIPLNKLITNLARTLIRIIVHTRIQLLRTPLNSRRCPFKILFSLVAIITHRLRNLTLLSSNTTQVTVLIHKVLISNNLVCIRTAIKPVTIRRRSWISLTLSKKKNHRKW